MKDKIKAIFHADTDDDIKIDLLVELINEEVDKETMNQCNSFLIFSANRNELLVDQLGLEGFIEDCQSTPTDQIWKYFKKYLLIKKQENEN